MANTCDACRELDLLERQAVAQEAIAAHLALWMYRKAAWLVAAPQEEGQTTPLPRGPAMPSQITMTNKQHVQAGMTILDRDGQPYPALPPGATAIFTSDHPEIADFVEDATGLNGDVTSGLVGVAVITGEITLQGGAVLTDTLTVTVVNSEATSGNFTVGVPVEES